jgi:vancomycin permeability regulator SanA
MRIAVFSLLTLLLVVVVAVILRGLNDDLQASDLAVVLGNKVEPDGTPSPQLKARLDHAIELYNQEYFKMILVSGAQGKEGYDEAQVMRQYLETNGVPSDAIFEDNKGNTTWNTAQNTAKFMQAHRLTSVLIISQYFHIARCEIAFSKFGINHIYTTHAPYWSLRDFYSVPREIVGCIVYFFRRADFPANAPASA